MILYTTLSISLRRHSDRTEEDTALPVGASMNGWSGGVSVVLTMTGPTGLLPTSLPSNFEPKVGSLLDKCGARATASFPWNDV